MKNIIILSIIFLSSVCYGQYKNRVVDSIWITGDSMYNGVKSFPEVPVIYVDDQIRSPIRKRDTVLVEAFVTDTFYRPHAPAYSLTLYSVRELQYYNEDSPQMPSGGSMYQQQSTYWQHIFYLGADKKPLSKSIIVWQAIEIE